MQRHLTLEPQGIWLMEDDTQRQRIKEIAP